MQKVFKTDAFTNTNFNKQNKNPKNIPEVQVEQIKKKQ